MVDIKPLIENRDYSGIRKALNADPTLSNEGITIPFDESCKIKAHPLHRICDPVMAGKITDEEAIELAKTFLEFGALINGPDIKLNEDTPLLAASSLHAENLAIFYIEHGADLDYKGRHDGATALHWAAFCGLDKLVSKLIREKATLDQPDTAYNCTPLGWALESLMSNERSTQNGQINCIKLLLRAGASIDKLNDHAKIFLRNLAAGDNGMPALL